MAIPIQCKGCGFRSSGVDELAGKVVKCRQCGGLIQVGRPAAAPGGYALAEDVFVPSTPAPAAPAQGKAGPTMRFGPPSAPRPSPSTSPNRPLAANRPAPAKPRPRPAARPEAGGISMPWLIGAAGGFLLLAIVTIALLISGTKSKRAGDVASGSSVAPITVQAILPPFPEVGAGAMLEPGVTLHQIQLPASGVPGHRGKLWLYLPAGAHQDRSLPCVMITGAGSTLLAGMDLGDGDRPEHLPYVREGFAVLAYELDGKANGEGDGEMRLAYEQFKAAQAGLVNARIALEFLLAKVPAVDPARIYSAGHSSAGTMSVLFAEHEPRLAGCLAYAPCIDLESRFGSLALIAMSGTLPGVRDFVTQTSPKNHEGQLNCPIFLFHAEDDSNVPVADTRASAARLAKLGKAATLEVVPTGDHYDSMIAQGIPRGIAWIKTQMASRGQSTPTTPTTAPGPIATAPTPYTPPAPSMPPPPPPPPSTPFVPATPPAESGTSEVPFSVAAPVSASTPSASPSPPQATLNPTPASPPPPPRFDPRRGRRRRG